MKRIMLGVLVSAVLLPLAVSAQGWGRGYGPGPMVLASLDLTANQKKKIEELRADYDRRVSDLQTRLDILRSDMAELWSADRPDRRAILAKHREMDAVRSQMREEGVDFRLAVMDLLTTDQLKNLKTWRGARGPGRGRGLGPCGRGMGWGRGRGGGKGRGPGWWRRFDDSP